VASDFDAVSDVAANLPITVVMDLIGWPMEAQATLYELAKGTFSAWGPDNQRMRAAISRYQSIRKLITDIYHSGTLEGSVRRSRRRQSAVNIPTTKLSVIFLATSSQPQKSAVFSLRLFRLWQVCGKGQLVFHD